VRRFRAGSVYDAFGALAISPALKKLGVKNRSRLFEIPPHIEYLTVKPHMKRYMQASAEIYGTLLKYVAPEDVHV